MSRESYFLTAKWLEPLRLFLAFIYGGLINTRNFFYDMGWFKTHHIVTPVISIGNISVGGTGKTLLTQALALYLLEQGKAPAILSRGYGRHSKGTILVSDDTSLLAGVREAGDEPFLMARNCPGVPVVVSENRAGAAQYIQRKLFANVIILDDGFQHRSIERKLDIVLLDTDSADYGKLLPAGRLREQPAALERADLIYYSKVEDPMGNYESLVFEYPDHVINHVGQAIPAEYLDGRMGLFCGLGNPQHFFSATREKFGEPVVSIEFPDHCSYTRSDLNRIRGASVDFWITTQKDFVKLDDSIFGGVPIYFLPVNVTVPESLKRALQEIL